MWCCAPPLSLHEVGRGGGPLPVTPCDCSVLVEFMLTCANYDDVFVSKGRVLKLGCLKKPSKVVLHSQPQPTLKVMKCLPLCLMV